MIVNNESWQLPTDCLKACRDHERVVLVTGVFDLLHQEHLMFLQKARAEGDVLLIGVESDTRVRQIKGPDRPINSQAQRVVALKETDITPYVFVLPEQFSSPEDHRRLIHLIKPKVLAVSSHTAHLDKKQKILSEVGGEVKIVHEHNPAISTTILLAKKPKPIS